MDSAKLRERISQIQWWHTIDLGNGIVTPGQQNSPAILEEVKLPEDLSGKTVLDVGAWDGFFSFEAERRGAGRVLATDSYTWNNEGWGSKAGFELAHEALESRVEDKHIDVLDLSPETVGMFDVVLFLGVLYHMRHPMLSIERVASVTNERLILETLVDMVGTRRPAMAFYPSGELNEDLTNWCGPNAPAVIAMLKVAGFKRVEVVSKRSLTYRFARAVKHRFRYGTPLSHAFWQNRMVFHASK